MWSMEDLDRLLNLVDYEDLWPNFLKAKYAVYNDKSFYINDGTGLGLNLVEKDSYFVGDVDERFIGNTAISINDNYIAIWNESTISEDMDNRKLASLIIHEMFHCFQLANGERRFPNEILGIDYPITIENINLRTLEREYLLGASIEDDKEKKMKLLSSYYAVRDKRENLIGNFIEYEKALESVEGIAVYVEYKALNQLNSNITLKEYIKGFAEISEENLQIRLSTYKQGLLLGLIADEFILNWKDEFFRSEQFLSDFIKSRLDIRNINIQYENENLPEVQQCINVWEEKRDQIFLEFQNRDKLNYLESGFQITGFDPMNIVKRNQEMIHKNFLRIRVGEYDQVIKGPIRVVIGDHFFDVKKIQW